MKISDVSAPLIISIVGKSDSGKTTLILKLIPELKKRGYRIAVAKHCPHGFDLDIEEKDSWKFTRAGGDGILLTSASSLALLRPEENPLNIKERLRNYFSDIDIVLMEGYNDESGIRKIEIIRRGAGRKVRGYLDTEKKIFNPDDIPAIADFIETFKEEKGK